MPATPLSAPSSPYGSFSEKGYAFQVLIPASAEEDRAFLLSVRDAGTEQLLLQLRLPMVYAPVFGVDIGDSAALEALTDAVLAALPAGGCASTTDIDCAVQAAQRIGAIRA